MCVRVSGRPFTDSPAGSTAAGSVSQYRLYLQAGQAIAEYRYASCGSASCVVTPRCGADAPRQDAEEARSGRDDDGLDRDIDAIADETRREADAAWDARARPGNDLAGSLASAAQRFETAKREARTAGQRQALDSVSAALQAFSSQLSAMNGGGSSASGLGTGAMVQGGQSTQCVQMLERELGSLPAQVQSVNGVCQASQVSARIYEIEIRFLQQHPACDAGGQLQEARASLRRSQYDARSSCNH